MPRKKKEIVEDYEEYGEEELHEIEVAPEDEELDIPLKDILTQKNARGVYKDEEMAELMMSIKHHGLLQNIVVERVKRRKGKYVLLAGFRRYTACKKLGYDTIRAKVKSETKKGDAQVIHIVENMVRSNVPDYQMGKYIQEEFIDKLDCTIDECAAKLNKSSSYIKRLLDNYVSTPVEYREAVINTEGLGVSSANKKGLIPSTLAHTLNKFADKNKMSIAERRKLFGLAKKQKVNVAKIQKANKVLNEQEDVAPMDAVQATLNTRTVRINFQMVEEEYVAILKKEKSIQKYFSEMLYGTRRFKKITEPL